MKCIFTLADQYVEESDWRTIALLKICLCSVGIMIGLAVPRNKRKIPLIIAAVVFLVTYIPLMWKLVDIVMRRDCKISEE